MLIHVLQEILENLTTGLKRPRRAEHEVDVSPDIANVVPRILKNSIGISEVVDAAGIFLGVGRITLRLDELSICDEKLGVVAAVTVQELEHIETAAAAARVTESKWDEIIAAHQKEYLHLVVRCLDVLFEYWIDELSVIFVDSDELGQGSQHHLDLLHLGIDGESILAELTDSFDDGLEFMEISVAD